MTPRLGLRGDTHTRTEAAEDETRVVAMLSKAERANTEFFSGIQEAKEPERSQETADISSINTIQSLAELDPNNFPDNPIMEKGIELARRHRNGEIPTSYQDKDYRSLVARVNWIFYHPEEVAKILSNCFCTLRYLQSQGVVDESYEIEESMIDSLPDSDIMSLINIYSILGCTFGNNSYFEESRKYHEIAIRLAEAHELKKGKGTAISSRFRKNSLTNRLEIESFSNLITEFEELVQSWSNAKSHENNIVILGPLIYGLLVNSRFDDVINLLGDKEEKIKLLNNEMWERYLKAYLREAYICRGGREDFEKAKALRDKRTSDEERENSFKALIIRELCLSAQEDIDAFRSHPGERMELEVRIVDDLKRAEDLCRRCGESDLLAMVLRIRADFMHTKAIITAGSKDSNELNELDKYHDEAHNCLFEAWELNEKAYGKTLEQMRQDGFTSYNCAELEKVINKLFPNIPLEQLRKLRNKKLQYKDVVKLLEILQTVERLSAGDSSNDAEMFTSLSQLLREKFQAEHVAVAITDEDGSSTVAYQNFFAATDEGSEQFDQQARLQQVLKSAGSVQYGPLWTRGHDTLDTGKEGNIALANLSQTVVPLLEGCRFHLLVGRGAKITPFSGREIRILKVLGEGLARKELAYSIKVLLSVVLGFYKECLDPEKREQSLKFGSSVINLEELDQDMPELIAYVKELTEAALEEHEIDEVDPLLSKPNIRAL